ncbi:hypothetical protein MMC14_001135 [Varicellaria rhodocarpa]|nr:hypothetical protein [Varicellaria rhodocarpa]
MVNNDGVLVSIITWFLLVTSTLAIVSRLSTKRAVSRNFHTDDVLAVLALVFSIGAGVAVSVQDANGLGMHIGDLTDRQKELFAKSSYAADLLFIATLCFAKLSMIALFHLITRRKKCRLLSTSLGVFTTIWATISLITAAFACHVPFTWNIFGPHCYNKVHYWYTFGIISIITDTALVLLSAYMVLALQMSTRKKILLLSCFGARSIDIVATATQLRYTSAFNSSDFTKTLWPFVLITQIIQCTTIITSCVPYLRPFIDAFPPDIFTSKKTRRRENTSGTREKYPDVLLQDRETETNAVGTNTAEYDTGNDRNSHQWERAVWEKHGSSE